MNFEKKDLSDGALELAVRVTKTEAIPWLTKAAAHISEHRPIKGFRPGKAPYEIVKKEFGEAVIFEEALEEIINDTFNSLLDKENFHIYGKVKFDLVPVLSPDDAVAYKATFTLMPSATLGNWQNKKIKRQEVKVSDEDIAGALDELANMTTAEQPAAREAKLGDKAVVDFEVFVDGKVIDGGSAKDFALVLGEGKMIPGFEEQIIGKKAGDKIEFQLSFPIDYQAEHLKGKQADFKITLNQILERTKPIIDDALAQKVGTKDLSTLKTALTENIKREKEQKEEERLEIAAIKQITETAKYDLLPQAVINDAISELIHDFEHSLAHQGVKFDQYLQTSKKTMEQIRKDFEPRATERVKSSIVMGKLAETEQIEVTAQEAAAEIEAQKKAHANNPNALADLETQEYRRHVANTILNRKLIDLIKSKIVE